MCNTWPSAVWLHVLLLVCLAWCTSCKERGDDPTLQEPSHLKQELSNVIQNHKLVTALERYMGSTNANAPIVFVNKTVVSNVLRISNGRCLPHSGLLSSDQRAGAGSILGDSILYELVHILDNHAYAICANRILVVDKRQPEVMALFDVQHLMEAGKIPTNFLCDGLPGFFEPTMVEVDLGVLNKN